MRTSYWMTRRETATGTTLICPKCGYLLSIECVKEFVVFSGLFYAECACGLCMFCERTRDGWEYRVMM